MMNPKQCLPGFVKCLKFAFEYNFKLICMSYKCLYDLVSAYVSNFNFYDLLLNFALHQSWVCFPIKTWPLYGPLCQHIPSPLHGTAAMQTPRHFQYCLHASKEAHADAPPPRLGNHSWTFTQWSWFVSLPVSNCYMGVLRLSVTHCCFSIYLQCLHIAST